MCWLTSCPPEAVQLQGCNLQVARDPVKQPAESRKNSSIRHRYLEALNEKVLFCSGGHETITGSVLSLLFRTLARERMVQAITSTASRKAVLFSEEFSKGWAMPLAS